MQKISTTNIRNAIKKGVENLQEYLVPDTDIISVIEEDHEPLKDLIQTMKNERFHYDIRVKAFQDFVPLLLTHAKAEEATLYENLKTHPELRHHAYEGDTEHTIADQLCEEIKAAEVKDEIIAKIKTLAELVEHHIEEEENDIFPEVKQELNEQTLQSLMLAYIREQEKFIAEGQTDSPSEQAGGLTAH